MFSGIISTLGSVRDVVASQTQRTDVLPEKTFTVHTGYSDLVLGESVALNGACLTVAEIIDQKSGTIKFFVSGETLNVTALSNLKSGDKVNLERALKLQDRLSGHLVSGHVDGMGTLLSITKHAESFDLVFKLASPLSQDCIKKGSICIQGISLTINEIELDQLSVRIIPHTWEHTTLQYLTIGEKVNIETDLIAKNIRHLMMPYLTQNQKSSPLNISMKDIF